MSNRDKRKSFFERLKIGLEEGIRYMRGEDITLRSYVVERPDDMEVEQSEIQDSDNSDTTLKPNSKNK